MNEPPAPFWKRRRLIADNAHAMRASSLEETRNKLLKGKQERERRRYAPGEPSSCLGISHTRLRVPRNAGKCCRTLNARAEEVTTSRSFSSSPRTHPVHVHHPHACACGRHPPAAASSLPDGQVRDLRSCRPRVCRRLLRL
jgi:hypothetical protein